MARTMRRSVLILVMAAALPNAEAQDRQPSKYHRLLLPFHASVSGQGGRWVVEWWLRNDGSLSADAFPAAFGCGLPPPPMPGGPAVFIVPYPSLGPQQTLSCLAGDARPSFPVPAFVPVRDSVGAFLHVEKQARRLTVSGSLGWQSAKGKVEPAQLTAIPESSFVSGTRSVLPVFVASDSRYALRVYALPETIDSPRLTIRIFEMQPQFVIRTEERLISTVSGDLVPQAASLPPCSGPCDVPQVELAPAIFQLFQLPKPAAGFLFPSPMRIEISPESPNLRWWAVVSATDNRTQGVRLYQPSP